MKFKKRSVGDFKRQAKKRRITIWTVHNCSMCMYPCGFIFVGDQVKYDSGCDCNGHSTAIRPCSWQEVAEHYNNQIDWASNPNNQVKAGTEQVIYEMNKYWGFE